MTGAYKHGVFGRLANFCQVRLGVQFAMSGLPYRLYESCFGKTGREFSDNRR